MSTDSVPNAALQRRVTLTFVLFAVLSFLNSGINYAFHRARMAEIEAGVQEDKRENEIMAEGNAKIDSRIKEGQAIVAENGELQKQAQELNERAKQLESAAKHSTSKSK